MLATREGIEPPSLVLETKVMPIYERATMYFRMMTDKHWVGFEPTPSALRADVHPLHF
jgi:hypothetical protein